jgi:hypothetical protein
MQIRTNKALEQKRMSSFTFKEKDERNLKKAIGPQCFNQCAAKLLCLSVTVSIRLKTLMSLISTELFSVGIQE